MDSLTPPIRNLQFEVIPGIPLIKPGDSLPEVMLLAIMEAGVDLVDGDILVVAQKIISKAEGRQVSLKTVVPSSEAEELAAETEKEAALCQLILDESVEILRKKQGVIIVRHRLGHVGANAGIDQSNIDHENGDSALLLPVDPDRSAQTLREEIYRKIGKSVGVLISDSMNRPWRLGTVGSAIGCAGIQVIHDFRGTEDMFGRELKVAMLNRADSLVATATLLMGETIERTPLVVVRGFPATDTLESAADMIRPLEDDLFR
jgi:coenzyme F420-0:L-glutamate ligase/coenzyme F420-1:gamma-L-glutamate ligase